METIELKPVNTNSTVSEDATLRVGFDFDGTLIDSIGFIAGSMKANAREMGCIESPLLQTENLRRVPTTQLFDYLGLGAQQLPEFVERVRADLTSNMEAFAFFDGVPEMLEAMHGRGWELSILTSNSSQNVEGFLKDAKRFFASVVGDAPVFEKANTIRAQNLDLYVGDETRDIQAARAAGTKSIGVNWGSHDTELLLTAAPDWIVRTPAELLDLVSEVAAEKKRTVLSVQV